MNARGLTLIEILIAATIAFIVMLAIGQIDVSRVRLGEEARRRANAGMDATLAIAHMGRLLQEADRVNLVGPDSIQFRRFTGDPTAAGALDNPANYHWAQYKLVDLNPTPIVDGIMDTIQFNDDTGVVGCGSPEDAFGAGSLLFQYQDEATTPPPGGEPLGGDDNNLLLITTSGGLTTEVVLRSGAYTNLTTGLSTAAGGPPGSC